jgi:hypothetical protein
VYCWSASCWLAESLPRSKPSSLAMMSRRTLRQPTPGESE